MMGWECPKCGRCYAPAMMACPTCCSVVAVSVPAVFGPACDHEYDENCSMPLRCKKCGALAFAPHPWTVTCGIVLNGGNVVDGEWNPA